MSYQIVTASSIQSLVEKVDILLRQGWITQGGVSYSSKERLYMQSMITGISPESEEETNFDDNDTEILATEDSEQFQIDESIPRKLWDYDEINISDIEGISTSLAIALIKQKIFTVGDLLRAVKTPEFEKGTSEWLKKAVKKLIEDHRWKE